MKKIIVNNDNLKEEDITEVVKRVKVLLINSNDEILLGYEHNDYQFPGGHVEDDESLIDTVKREIKEEVGIDLNIDNIEPFAVSIGYWKDWPLKGMNRKTEIYYFEIKSDLKPNLNNTNYTNHEKEGKFELRYIPLDNVENVLKENAKAYGDQFGIAREMLDLFKMYRGK